MVAGNWKMNTTVEEGVALARAVRDAVTSVRGVDVAVLPPFTHLWAVRSALEGSAVLLGGQDVYWKDSGAFTGEISPAMLAGWCDITLVGHSERRHLFGERDDEVGQKFVAALAHGLQVILAVGETSDERDGGNTFDGSKVLISNTGKTNVFALGDTFQHNDVLLTSDSSIVRQIFDGRTARNAGSANSTAALAPRR